MGPMAERHENTDRFRGGSFVAVDMTDTVFRDCDLRQAKIVDSWLSNVQVSGYVDKLVVNDVDVTEFVNSELDRRHPERKQVRDMKTADEYRATWAEIEQLWAGTVAEYERLPDSARSQRVNDEWSLSETLRHLVFAIDAWASRTVLDQEMPFHRLGLTHSSHPRAEAVALGIDVDATPSFAEVMEARADRQAVVRGILEGLTDAELDRTCTRIPAPGYPDELHSVGTCLRVVMKEECEHRRYIVRDFAALTEA
jgi:uncharacterized damage-inducible protein DinB